MPASPFYITTSWDDGHPLDLRLAEMLAKYGLAATFYVPIRHHQKLINAEEIRGLSRSFEIGGHTLTHCDLRSVPYDVSRYEIGNCKDALEQITSLPCRSFCFPKGRFRRGHIAQVKAAGFTLARTVELMSLSTPRSQSGIALMPTTIQAGPAGAMTYFKNAAKRLRPGNFLHWTRFRGDTWVATLDALLTSAAERGGVVHLWGHSFEIEQNKEWSNLDRAFSLLAQYKTRARFASNGELLNLLSRSPALPGTSDDTQALAPPSALAGDLMTSYS
jgi:hypothetical protein